MATLKKTQNDFSAGEISPKSQGRIDTSVYQKGVDRIINFIPLVQGGVTRRPPTQYISNNVNQTKKNRNIPFSVSSENNYTLVFSENIVYVYKDREYVTTFATTYLEDDLEQIYYTQSVDTLFLACTGHVPRKLVRESENSFTLSAIEFKDGPYFDENESAILLNISSYTDRAVLYCNESLFTSALVGKTIEYKYEDEFYIAEVIEFTDSQNLTVRPISNILTAPDPTAKLSYSSPNITSTVAIFSYENVNKHIRLSSTTWYKITDYNSTTEVAASSVTVHSTSFATNMCVLKDRVITSTINSTNSLFESTDEGRMLRLRLGNTSVWGKIKTFNSSTEVITEFYTGLPYSNNPDSEIESDGETREWRLGAWNSVYGYPETLTFNNSRLCFHGNNYQPNRVWMSEIAEYFSFAPTGADSTVSDSNAVTVELNSNKANKAQWISSGKSLLTGTSGNVWQISPSYFQNNITPSDVGTTLEDPYGSKKIPPLDIENAKLYVQKYGRSIREIFYNFQTQSYQTSDLTAVADHLFVPNNLGEIKEIAFQSNPFGIIWVVTDKGNLCTLTYSRQYGKFAWARQEIGGTDVFVESVSVVENSQKNQDDVYLTISRTINGATTKYVEVIANEFLPSDSEDYNEGFFQDSFIFYDGVSTNIIGNLSHLEGETVQVCVDGGPIGEKTVNLGIIVLDEEVTNVSVGLFKNGLIKLLSPEAILSDTATTHGKTKAITSVDLKFLNSLNCEIYLDNELLYEYVFRTLDEEGTLLDTRPNLFTGTKECYLSVGYQKEPSLEIKHTSATPLTILMATISFDLST